MASIVEQQQDLFFEYEANSSFHNEESVLISDNKDAVFLIGCFRNDQKHQLDWIRNNSESNNVGRYNVRIGKGRDGWINKENPRINNPQYAILYEFGNEEIVYYYRINGSIVYSEEDMQNAGYAHPNGDYLVYKLSHEVKSIDINVQKILKYYRDNTNWIDGKPIYLSGKEIITALRPQTKTRKKEKGQMLSLFSEDNITLQDVFTDLKNNVDCQNTAYLKSA